MVVAGVSSGAVPQASVPPTYKPEQVAAGKAAYKSTCAICHGEKMEGGVAPSLKTESFRATWMDSPSSSLAGFIKGAMPPNNIGGLDAETYEAIAVYLLSENMSVAAEPVTPAVPAAPSEAKPVSKKKPS